jgi:hypothetical protein
MPNWKMPIMKKPMPKIPGPQKKGELGIMESPPKGNQLWDLWPELTVYNEDTRTAYIQTPDEKWTTYFSIWRRAMIEDRNTKCPSPMPFGHMMFDKVKAPPKTDKQTELPFGKLPNGNPIRTKEAKNNGKS